MRTASGALAALLLGAAIAPWHASAVTCQEALVGKRYRCTVRSEAGFVGDLCFEFVSPGTASPNFDLVGSSFFGDTLGCMCQATGSFKRPQFNQSTAFLCGSRTSRSSAVGKVSGNGKKITKGHYNFDGTPVAHVFTCTLDPGCTVP
jgi:hypothetical protein